MISERLINQIEDCADLLTNDLVKILKTDPRCPAYRGLASERLIELKDDLYRNMKRWLSERSRSAVESRYVRLGRERYLEGIPLSQVIFALNLTKSMLLNFIRRCMTGRPEELALEYELALSISDFFDQALHSVAVGYEDAYQAHLAPHPKAEPAPPTPKRPAVKRATAESGDDVDLPVSRAGQIGEASG